MTRGPDLGALGEVYGTVKRFFEWILVAVILGFTLVCVLGLPARIARGDDDVKRAEPKRLEQLKPAHDAGAANLETCLKRAIERAVQDAGVRGTKLARATVSPSDTRQHQSYLVVCEFKDKSVALFQGGCEAQNDQYVVISKDQLSLATEATTRQ